LRGVKKELRYGDVYYALNRWIGGQV